MIDVELIQEDYGYDITIRDGDITPTDTFKTAIEVSLFSDARATSDQVFVPQARRGWIGDIATPIEDQLFGSYLWLVEQKRLTQGTVNEVVSYARLALQWLIDQGQALTVDVGGSIIAGYGIALNIIITSVSGATENRYVELWENTVNAN